MTAIEPVLGTVYRVDATDPPDLGAATLDIANMMSIRSVGFQATETSRNAAYLTMINGTAPYTSPKTGMRCYVATTSMGYPDICTYVGGGEWLYDHPAPLLYQSVTFGASFAITNTGYGGVATYLYAFTPTRTGYATIGAHVDIMTVTKGWLSAYCRPRWADGTQLPGGLGWVVGKEPAVTYAGIPAEWRAEGDFVNQVPVRLQKGVTVTLAPEAGLSNAGGAGWQFNSFQWRIVQY